MGFPYDFHENWESGTLGGFNSETDANGVLNFLSAKDMVRRGFKAIPQRGNFACVVDLNGRDTNQYLQEDDGFDIDANNALYIGFSVCITDDLVMANTNRFTLFTLQSSGPVDEVVLDVKYTTAAGYQFVLDETQAGSSTVATNIELNKHHFIEIYADIDNAGADDGNATLWVDGNSIGSITGLDQGAIVQARLGAIGLDAGTTAGKIIFSEIFADSERFYPVPDRFEVSRVIAKSEHVFIGPGTVGSVALLSTDAGDKLLVYDTDDYTNTPNAQDIKVELAVGNLTSFSGPLAFRKGCYVAVSGTNPRGQLIIDPNPLNRGEPLILQSEGVIRNWLMSN